MGFQANRRVETSVRTFAIIEHLSKTDTAGVSEIAGNLDMSKGIVHNHISTLRELGYVRKIGECYQLSPKLLATGLRARSNAPLYRHVAPLVESFASEFDVGTLLIQDGVDNCHIMDDYSLPANAEVSVGGVLGHSNSLAGLVLWAQREPDLASLNPEAYDLDSVTAQLNSHGYATGQFASDINIRCVAFPVVNDDIFFGSVVILIPSENHEMSEGEIKNATASLRERIEVGFTTDWANNRSFATEKHSWIS